MCNCNVQVAPCGKEAAAGRQQLEQLGLQSLVQQARAASRTASRLASHARDSRASPAPSCPTPITQRAAGKQAYEGSQCTQDLPKDRASKQAASAPLLLAPMTEPRSAPSLRDMLLMHGLRTNSALGSTGAAIIPGRSEQALQQESSNKAATASAQAAAAPARRSGHHGGRSGSLATQSAAASGGLDVGLHSPPASSLHSLEQPQRGSKQAPAASKQLASSVQSPGSRGRAGRSGRLSAAQALFPEIQSRLPPVSFAMAGYTDAYDFPEGALAVADSFLRDAPSLDRPEGSAMPYVGQAMMRSSTAAGGVEAQSAASLHRSTDPSPSDAVRGSNPGPTGTSALAPPAEIGAGALVLEGPHVQAGAAGRPAAVAQETEQRSCRSSVTPHKTGTRDTNGEEDSLRLQQQREPNQRHAKHAPARGDDSRAENAQASGTSMATATASDSDSSQAAHDSQAGVAIPIKSADATATAQQGGTSGEADYGRSPGGSSVQRELNARCDHDRRQQPQMSSPNSGLDVLAAAASAVGAVPKGRAGRGLPVARSPGGNAVSGWRGKVPDQAAAAGATPGRKRKAHRDTGPSNSPDKKQRPHAAAVSTPSKATPGRGKRGRPKTPSKARNRPASAASPLPNGIRRRQEASDTFPQRDCSSFEDAPQHPLRSPGAGNDRTTSRTYKDPSRVGKGGAAPPSRETLQLRDRASIAEKGAKPWWVV